MLRILLIGLGILLFALFLRLWIGNGSYSDIWRLEHQIEERKQANKVQQQENRKLQAEIEEFHNGTSVIEERARSELGFIRKRENFYQIILSPEPEEPIPEANNPHNKSTEEAPEEIYE